MQEPEQQSPPTAAESLKIGASVRRLRSEKGVSLNKLAQIAGVSKSNLSKIENDVISPTFDTIEKLAKGLDIPAAALLSAQDPAHELLVFNDAGSGARSSSGHYDFEFLFTELGNRRMVPFVTTVRPQNTEETPVSSSHKGEEFFYVLDGLVEFISDGRVVRTMKQGDSVYFNSAVKHLVRNCQDTEARLLWVWLA